MATKISLPNSPSQITAEEHKKLSKPIENNFILLMFGYSTTFVLPYEDAMNVLAAFKKAEVLNSDDFENKHIEGLDHVIDTKIISKGRYIELKIAKLLKGV